jgi:predicted Zn-dependent protease
MTSGTFSAPMGLEKDIVSKHILGEANEVFLESAEYWEKNQAEKLGYNNNLDRVIKFSKEKRQKFFEGEHKFPREKIDEMEDVLKKITSKLSLHPKIYEVEAYLKVKSSERYFVNSDGSEIFTNYNRYGIYIVPKAVDKLNLLIPYYDSIFWSTDLDKMPSPDKLMEMGEKGVKNLLEVIKSPIEKSGPYPAIMMGRIHGILWHEVIGHALEGHRMQEDEEGNMTTEFKERIGEKIAPEFLSLYDDPTIEDLNGHYKFDEEGIPGRRVTLVENGILKNYLHSRQSAGFFETKSNGHARNEDTEDPVPRMSNLVVKSTNEISFEELKEDLIKLCKEQGRPYGLIMDGLGHGFTIPDESFFNVFPEDIFRIYQDGKMQRVRGIKTVGSPSNILDNIVKTGKNYEVFNGVCGAESGLIPQTNTAPEGLIKSIVVGNISRSEYPKIRNKVIK